MNVKYAKYRALNGCFEVETILRGEEFARLFCRKNLIDRLVNFTSQGNFTGSQKWHVIKHAAYNFVNYSQTNAAVYAVLHPHHV